MKKYYRCCMLGLTGCMLIAFNVLQAQITFTAPDDLCVDDGILTNQSAGSPAGGTYSGPGVTDNGDGTYDFDPAAAGVGTHTITYTLPPGFSPMPLS